MKSFLYRFIFVVIAAVTAILLPADVSAGDIFESLVGDQAVSSNYVSGKYGKIVSFNSSILPSSVADSDIFKSFSSIYTYSVNSRTAYLKARNLLDDYVKKEKDSVELVMKQVSMRGIQQYELYYKTDKTGKLFQMIIWNASSPATTEIVVIYWKDGVSVKPTSFYPGYNGVLNSVMS